MARVKFHQGLFLLAPAVATAALAIWLLPSTIIPESWVGGGKPNADGHVSPRAGPMTALHSTAAHAFVTPSGRAVQLRAVNMIPVWRYSPGRTWRESDYVAIRRQGFNAVRFVLYWRVFEPQRGIYRQTSLRTLDLAIERARAAGLYVVLDEIHLWGTDGVRDVPGWARSGDSVHSVLINGGGYLETLARRYHNQAAVAAYDLVSEFYRYPIDQNAVLRTYDRLITQVRTVDPTKIILIEPTYGDSSIAGGLANLAILRTRRNVVWSIHDFFAGGSPDGYASDGSEQGQYTWNGVTGYSRPDRLELARHLATQISSVAQIGLPVWIGEFGIGAHTINHDRWIDDQVAVFKSYGLGWAWWAYGTDGPFSITGPDHAWRPWVRLVSRPA